MQAISEMADRIVSEERSAILKTTTPILMNEVLKAVLHDLLDGGFSVVEEKLSSMLKHMERSAEHGEGHILTTNWAYGQQSIDGQPP